jgi:arylsulfatase A-like enzyme
MWRSGGWKLIQYLPGKLDDALLRVPETQGELYNLDADPLELINLYDEPAHVARREQMTRELLMHLAVAWTKYPLRQPALPQDTKP